MSHIVTTDEAMKLYRPPFRYEHGYIFDADHRMVADNDGMDTMGRVRGWGRIGALPNTEALQDKVGELIAQALTEFWQKSESLEIPDFLRNQSNLKNEKLKT